MTGPSYRAQVVLTQYVKDVGWLTVIGGIVTDNADDPRFAYTLPMWQSRIDELDWRSPVMMFREVLALSAKTAEVCSHIFSNYYIDEEEEQEPSSSPAPPHLDDLWTEGLEGVDLDPKGDEDATSG